jgi:hypothetical protein
MPRSRRHAGSEPSIAQRCHQCQWFKIGSAETAYCGSSRASAGGEGEYAGAGTGETGLAGVAGAHSLCGLRSSAAPPWTPDALTTSAGPHWSTGITDGTVIMNVPNWFARTTTTRTELPDPNRTRTRSRGAKCVPLTVLEEANARCAEGVPWAAAAVTPLATTAARRSSADRMFRHYPSGSTPNSVLRHYERKGKDEPFDSAAARDAAGSSRAHSRRRPRRNPLGEGNSIRRRHRRSRTVCSTALPTSSSRRRVTQRRVSRSATSWGSTTTAVESTTRTTSR